MRRREFIRVRLATERLHRPTEGVNHARHVSANFALDSSRLAANPCDGSCGATTAPVMVHIHRPSSGTPGIVHLKNWRPLLPSRRRCPFTEFQPASDRTNPLLLHRTLSPGRPRVGAFFMSSAALSA
jgi:hypothetical protein